MLNRRRHLRHRIHSLRRSPKGRYLSRFDLFKPLERIPEGMRGGFSFAFDTMTFQQVKAVLESRYGVETRTIGNFSRRQLPSYETTGGNKKKMIVLK